MKLRFLTIALCFFIQTFVFGQLEQLIGAITESGTIVYTPTRNDEPKRKNVADQKVYAANERVFATIYMKQLFSRLNLDERNAVESFRLKIALTSDPTQYVVWDIAISEAEKLQKFMCFELIPEALSLDNVNHIELAKLMKNLSDERHQLELSIVQRELVKGTLTLDFSNGKGVFQQLLDDIAEKQRLEQEKVEQERIAKEQEEQRKMAAQQQKIDDYNAQSDFFEMNFKNDAEFAVSIYIETDDKLTDRKILVKAASTQQIRCRPTEKIYAGNDLVHTVDKNSKGKNIDVTISDVKIYRIYTKWTGDAAWTSWIIQTSVGDWYMNTKWTGDYAWREWKIETNGPAWDIIAKWTGPTSWTNWVYKTPKGTITMDTEWTGDNAWSSWNISSKMGDVYVKTKWTGDDAWRSWNISSTFGGMKMRTKWTGDDAWRSWEIDDSMNKAPASLKMAAVFTCIIGGLRP